MKLSKEFWEKRLGKEWTSKLQDMLKSEYAEKLNNFLNKAYSTAVIYPDRKDLFSAFADTPFDKVKVVVLDREPYLDGRGAGGAYANKFDVFTYSPPVMKIFEQIERDYHDGLCLDFDFTLQRWKEGGVLLLNMALSVERNKIGSHTKPWEKFTKEVIKSINEYHTGVVFMLWGKGAQSYKDMIGDHHHILEYGHPLNAWKASKDWKCPNFKECDEILIKQNGSTIRW
jgi:uracil-DNA glycosylase